ncbi:MAG: hypothetical protein AAF909_04860 [Pseudomonadota bacterium]
MDVFHLRAGALALLLGAVAWFASPLTLAQAQSGAEAEQAETDQAAPEQAETPASADPLEPTASLVAIPGTIVALAPPPGFELSDAFSGFESPDGASILVNELPIAAAVELDAVFADLESAATAFAPRGVTLDRAITLEGPGADDLDLAASDPKIYAGTQTLELGSFQKWIGVYKGASLVLVTFQAPSETPVDEAALSKAFASVRLRAALSEEEQTAALPYELSDTGDLRRVAIMPNGASIYTIGPLDVDPSALQPILIVAPSLGQPPILPEDREQLSRQMLDDFPNFDIAEIETAEEREVDGAPGFFIQALGRDTDRDQEMRVLQLTRFGAEGGYLRLVAQAPTESWAEAEPSFTALLGGLTMK